MFGNKKNTDLKEKKLQDKMTTDNILEVFSKDMMREKKQEIADKLGEKDIIYYLTKLTSLFKIVFFIVFSFGVLLFSYLSIQKNSEVHNLNYLKPVCGFFIGDIAAADYNGCTSLMNAKNVYDDKLKKIQGDQAKLITDIVDEVYALDNFLFTTDISFLLTKSSSKLPVSNILSDFNNLKEAFEPNKGIYSIECNKIIINNDWEMNMSCTSYSSDWSEGNIIGFNGQINSKKISGTSITVAASFINFINSKSDNFKIVEATKLYNYDNQVGDGKERYTKKTTFDLTLKYSNPIAK